MNNKLIENKIMFNYQTCFKVTILCDTLATVKIQSMSCLK